MKLNVSARGEPKHKWGTGVGWELRVGWDGGRNSGFKNRIIQSRFYFTNCTRKLLERVGKQR
jgi:hypothetical protein